MENNFLKFLIEYREQKKNWNSIIIPSFIFLYVNFVNEFCNFCKDHSLHMQKS